MRIGELAAASGLTRETLRFYEREGLIRARRLSNGYRHYPPETVMLVQYIRTAQQLGFTLAEIGHRLPEVWDGPDAAAGVVAVLAQKLQEIDGRIAALQALRQDLAARLPTACPLSRTGDVAGRDDPDTAS
ncbi:MerR family transcriptional regulator [Ideonella sp.]|uniref:MerR family transcriptional regulator n=1 Tax=Ideonella sp. TaxID=1929293 RepID=UPI0035B46011